MGVINLTSDSFSDGGHLFSGNKVDLSKALRKVEKLMFVFLGRPPPGPIDMTHIAPRRVALA